MVDEFELVILGKPEPVKRLYSVLIVDDEENPVKGLSNMLGQLYNIHAAYSGEEALEFLHCESVDAVVLDMKMHGMDGVETASRIHGLNPALPVIIHTAHYKDG